MEIVVRPCVSEDADALALVGAATFLESYAGKIDGQGLIRHCAEKQSPDFYQQALTTPGHALWIVEADEAPVGYAHICPPELGFEGYTDADLELKRIYLLSRFHGQGLGRELMRLAEDHARQNSKARLLVGVHNRNEAALAFYKTIGYKQISEHPYNVGGVIYNDPILAKVL